MHAITAMRPTFLFFRDGQLMRQTDRAWIGQPNADGTRTYRHATGQVQVASLTTPKRVVG